MNTGVTTPVPFRIAAKFTLPILILAWAVSTSAATPAPQSIPIAVTQAVPELQLSGTGTYRWFGLQIYDAALWTPRTSTSQPDWSRPLVLQLRYARTLRGADIAQRSIDEIEKLGIATPEQRQNWLAAMRALLPDVREGSTLAGFHQPGRGARFFHNGQPLGDIDDAAFSRAFFSIWLHAATSAPALREALLGRQP